MGGRKSGFKTGERAEAKIYPDDQFHLAPHGLL